MAVSNNFLFWRRGGGASSVLCYYLRLALYLVGFLFLVCLLRTLTTEDFQLNPEVCSRTDSDYISLTPEMVEHFQGAIRLPTISPPQHEIHTRNATPFLQLLKHIETSFPLIYSSPAFHIQVVNKLSLLMIWNGTDPKLLPGLFSCHLDVVPIAENDVWEFPPFSGERTSDDFIYGRGTIDDKSGVLGLLEATEYVLRTKGETFRPRRTLIYAFGHDEEVNGKEGALEILKLIQAMGINNLEFIFDEGLPIGVGLVPGIDQPVALIGSVEKGFLSLKLSVKNIKGGHSSMPHPTSAIGILATAVSRLEQNPLPSRMGPVEMLTMTHLAFQLPFPMRFILRNSWLFGPLIKLFYSLPHQMALIRTTTALTIFRAGNKENVIPTSAEAIINHRILPSSSLEETIALDKAIINDDRVQIEIAEYNPPSFVSPVSEDSFGFQILQKTIRQLWPDTLVAPALLVGATDSRHYRVLTKNVYRFVPIRMTRTDTQRFHGCNERIHLSDYERAINFYYHYLVNADDAVTPKHAHKPHDSEQL